MADFKSLGFNNEALLANLNERFENGPTVFQQKAMPQLLTRIYENTVLRSPSCSGKSVALLASICERIMWTTITTKDKATRAKTLIQALIVTPSDDSTIYLANETMALVKDTNIVVSYALRGKDGRFSQNLSYFSDILIGSIDALHELIVQKKTLKLDNMRMFVGYDIDVLESGSKFETFFDKVCHTSEAFFAFFSTSKPDYQCKLQMDCAVFVDHAESHLFDQISHSFLDVTQHLIGSAQMPKICILHNWLKLRSRSINGKVKAMKTVIFVNDDRIANFVAIYLLKHNFKVLSMHNKQSTEHRKLAYEYFVDGKLDIIVVSDLIEDCYTFKVKRVVNFDLPLESNHCIRLIDRFQRIHSLSNGVKAVSFVDCRENSTTAYPLKKLFVELNMDVPSFFTDAYNLLHQKFTDIIYEANCHFYILDQTFN